MCNQGSQRTSSRLESVYLNFHLKKTQKTKQSLQAERKMCICHPRQTWSHAVYWTVQAYEMFFNPSNNFCFIAAAAKYLGKAYTLKKKTQKTFQLFWPFINIMFWQLRIIRMRRGWCTLSCCGSTMKEANSEGQKSKSLQQPRCIQKSRSLLPPRITVSFQFIPS